MKKSSTLRPAFSKKTHSKKSHNAITFTLPFMKKRKAFTLIELMIAMAIIAVLATAGIQAYTGYIKKGRDTARAEIADNLNTAVVSYAASNNGLPPASAAAFDEFLASAGSTFGVSSSLSSSGVLVEDPVGGKEVCLDAEGNANQPCAFHYTAYEDGTYAISYGVEHETSTEDNFYKTTDSVVAVTETVQEDAGSQTPVPKYGVYTGTARYIGQTSVQTNGTTNDGIDVVYTPPGAVAPPQPVFRSITMNVVSGGGGGGGIACTTRLQCSSGLECISNTCQAPADPCDPEYFSGNISMVSYDTQITDYGGGELGVIFSNIVGVDGDGRPASMMGSAWGFVGPQGVTCGVYGDNVQCSFNEGGPMYAILNIDMALDACWEQYDGSVEATFEI